LKFKNSLRAASLWPNEGPRYEGANTRAKFIVFDGGLSSLDVYCGALKLRAEVVSAAVFL